MKFTINITLEYELHSVPEHAAPVDAVKAKLIQWLTHYEEGRHCLAVEAFRALAPTAREALYAATDEMLWLQHGRNTAECMELRKNAARYLDTCAIWVDSSMHIEGDQV